MCVHGPVCVNFVCVWRLEARLSVGNEASHLSLPLILGGPKVHCKKLK